MTFYQCISLQDSALIKNIFLFRLEKCHFITDLDPQDSYTHVQDAYFLLHLHPLEPKVLNWVKKKELERKEDKKDVKDFDAKEDIIQSNFLKPQPKLIAASLAVYLHTYFRKQS